MIKIYDTKLRQKVEFQPKEPGKISIYVCGPTVYNRIHIGNARTFISFDVIRRYLIWRGFDVTFVQNVTDVDDKIIKRAGEEDRSAAEVAAEYTQAFIDDMHAAGVLDPDVRPRATGEIPDMIALVQELVDGGHAYEVEGDVYFSVRSYPAYGELSGRNIDEMESGHRELRADGQGLEARKRDPLDFALWKAAKPGEPSWDSPWGKGRPGWHIECSAMSRKYLGLPFDIHGGGADLVFPHHENERAQSEAACGCTFARHWMHSGMLQIANEKTGEIEKMSKSLNNFLLLHEALDIVRPETLRMLMLQTHYRSPLVFGDARLAEADAALTRIENTVKNLEWLLASATAEGACALDAAAIEGATQAARAAFVDAMDDDFNAPAALGAVFTLVGDVNSAIAGKEPTAADVPALIAARDSIAELMGVFGIDVAAATPILSRSSILPLSSPDTRAATQPRPSRRSWPFAPRRALRRIGPVPTPCAMAWRRSALRLRTRRKALRWKWRSAQACFRRAEERDPLNTQRNMELLAPAGGIEQLRAAVRFGADAVYLASDRFGMRARAANFALEGIPAAVEIAHAAGVKVHVTANILMEQGDLAALPDYFRALDAAGVDAFIIGDLGAAAIARRVAPRVALHVSTQASVANSEAARVWYSLGASRVVCAREMSLDDIARMREDMPADMEIEAFAHGAMCMAVSGRCLISSYLTGRSGNRGHCTQPCRWGYTLEEEKRPGEHFPIEEDGRGTFIMNAKDMNMLAHLDALRAAGVDSIKIEGRNKKAFYVASVVNAYRQVLDGAPVADFAPELEAVSHRPYGTGFFFGEAEQAPNYDGYEQQAMHVADVVTADLETRTIVARCRNRFAEGEELEILSPRVPISRVVVRNLTWLPDPTESDPDPAPVPVPVANRSCGIYRFSVGAGVGACAGSDDEASADVGADAVAVPAAAGADAGTRAGVDILPAAGDFLRVRRFRRSARSGA